MHNVRVGKYSLDLVHEYYLILFKVHIADKFLALHEIIILKTFSIVAVLEYVEAVLESRVRYSIDSSCI